MATRVSLRSRSDSSDRPDPGALPARSKGWFRFAVVWAVVAPSGGLVEETTDRLTESRWNGGYRSGQKEVKLWASHPSAVSESRSVPANRGSRLGKWSACNGSICTRPALTWVAAALRIAAHSVSRSDSAFGACYRRLRATHGAPTAMTATAHTLARLIYTMLKHRRPSNDPGADAVEERYRQHAIQTLKRKAKKLGLEVVPASV